MLRQFLRQLGISTAGPASDDVQTTAQPARNGGWCACCRSETEFVETGVWLRDQYLCARCGSIPRFRALNLTLDKYFPAWEQASIHESSPSNDFIVRYCAKYSSSYYFDGVEPGR